MQELVIGKVSNRTTGKKISGVKLSGGFFPCRLARRRRKGG
jgi:hypothetical protein